MRALLISPCYPDTFWSFRHALRLVRKQAAFPPLGLLTVAALLPQDWDVRLIDLNAGTLRDADLAWADSVWIGGMTVQATSAEQVIERCRAAGVTTIVGGPMATCEPGRFARADHLVLNEAETTLPEFLADFQPGVARRVYENPRKPDLTSSPAPRWDLLDWRRYYSMSVQFGRGCPFDCDFCNVTSLFGRSPRVKTAAQSIAELDTLYRRGWRGPVFYVDDNLIGNKRGVRELLAALIEWRRGKTGVPLQTQASINLADSAELQNLMTQAGFDTVFVGIETPSEDSLRECSKKQNLRRDLAADVRKLQRAGLEVQAGFILGFDSDTPSIFRRQIEFIQRCGIVTAMVGLLQAPLGTRLHTRLRGAGRLLGEMSGDNVDGSTNVATRIPIEELKAGYRYVMSELYAPKRYLQRLMTVLREYRVRGGMPRLDLPRTAAFVRSLWSLGVRDPARWHYWRLLAWTILRRPRSLARAVSLWIHGYHFRETCRLRLST